MCIRDRDKENNPVIITETKEAMAYKRTINYIQVPIFAHLAWGREPRGLNIFVNAGPQFGDVYKRQMLSLSSGITFLISIWFTLPIHTGMRASPMFWI